MSFQNKIAIVTGAGGYIGGRISRRLLEQGASVALFDIAQEGTGKIAGEYEGAAPLTVNLTDAAAVQNAVALTLERFGKIDLLVTSAGGSARSRMRPFAQQDMGVIREIIEMNLFGALNVIHAVAPHMLRQNRGKIVNISSIVAIGGVEGSADYAAAKAGVIAATKTLAMEFGRYNVNINCVAPGKVRRPDEMPADPDGFARKYSFLNRICAVDDIAELVLYLLSEKADYITGQNYIVDGGRSLGLKGDH